MDTIDEPSSRGRKTTLEVLQEQFERQMAPFRRLQEMQDLVQRYSPGQEVSELLRRLETQSLVSQHLRLSTLSTQWQDILDRTAFGFQAEKLLDQYLPKNLLGTSDEAWRNISRLSAALPSAGRYDELLKGLSPNQEWLDKLQRQALGGLSAEDFARRFTETSSSLRAMQEAKKSLDRLWSTFQEIDFSQFEPSAEDEEAVERAAQTITQAAGAQDDFKDAVQQILNAIQAQRTPAVQVVVWLFFRKILDWLIAGAIGAVMGHYAPAILGDSPQAAKKAVLETARVAVGSTDLLLEYRYVTAKLLVVRQTPKARSPEVGRLVFGNAVKLLKKEKDFALVQWADKESGAEIQGWVFARYLGRFQ